MRLASEILKELENIQQILADDEEADVEDKLTCCDYARWEAWAEALTFCLYAEGDCP